MNPETPGPTKMETLQGGMTLRVQSTDGTSREDVLIKQLGLRDCLALSKAIEAEDEIAQIRVYTGRDEKWIDGIMRESQEQIIIEGERINMDFFSRWKLRTQSRSKYRQGTLEERLAEKMLPQLLEAQSTSPTGSPKPPLSAASLYSNAKSTP